MHLLFDQAERRTQFLALTNKAIYVVLDTTFLHNNYLCSLIGSTFCCHPSFFSALAGEPSWNRHFPLVEDLGTCMRQLKTCRDRHEPIGCEARLGSSMHTSERCDCLRIILQLVVASNLSMFISPIHRRADRAFIHILLWWILE